MEVVALLRVLWRHRIAVAVGAVVAIAVGLLVMRSDRTQLGVASMRVILDTPNSQTVDVAPVGVTTLEWRTGLYADLMADQTSRERIARSMGIDVDQLVVRSPALSAPLVVIPLPQAALDAAGTVAEPYELAIQALPPLPIIAIDARAPSREAAGRLASAAAEALKAATEVELTAETQQFVMTEVGPPKTRAVVNGPGRPTAAIIVVVVFCAWCTGITLIAALTRGRRPRRRPRRRRPPVELHSA
jgi:hypothetical protein